MKRKKVRDPMSGRWINVRPTREELKADILSDIDRCIRNFAVSREQGWAKRYRHLAYKLRAEHDEAAPPLY